MHTVWHPITTVFLYIKMPLKIVLGKVRKPKGIGSKRRLIEKEESFMYVPVLKTLETLLNSDVVLVEVH